MVRVSDYGNALTENWVSGSDINTSRWETSSFRHHFKVRSFKTKSTTLMSACSALSKMPITQGMCFPKSVSKPAATPAMTFSVTVTGILMKTVCNVQNSNKNLGMLACEYLALWPKEVPEVYIRVRCVCSSTKHIPSPHDVACAVISAF
jgi:hypothetical protein